MRSLRLTPALLATVLTALVSFWLCFAVVASATRTSSPPTASVDHPSRQAAGAVGSTLTLNPVAALHVRSALLRRSPARPHVARRKHRRRTRPIAIDVPTSPEPAPAMSTAAAPAATSVPVASGQPTPSPRPAPTPRPTVTAAPKRAAPPDFDESQPSDFDNAG